MITNLQSFFQTIGYMFQTQPIRLQIMKIRKSIFEKEYFFFLNKILPGMALYPQKTDHLWTTNLCAKNEGKWIFIDQKHHEKNINKIYWF